MKDIIIYTLIAATLTVIMLVAMDSIDKITVRDCERGIKGACEEVERLQLTKEGDSKLNLK